MKTQRTSLVSTFLVLLLAITGCTTNKNIDLALALQQIVTGSHAPIASTHLYNIEIFDRTGTDGWVGNGWEISHIAMVPNTTVKFHTTTPVNDIVPQLVESASRKHGLLVSQKSDIPIMKIYVDKLFYDYSEVENAYAAELDLLVECVDDETVVYSRKLLSRSVRSRQTGGGAAQEVSDLFVPGSFLVNQNHMNNQKQTLIDAYADVFDQCYRSLIDDADLWRVLLDTSNAISTKAN